MDRSMTRREEMANALSHGLGFLLATAATPLLVVSAVRRGGAADIVGSSVFGATLILLYLASTSYHAAPLGRLKDWLQRFDHAAIYLLIAGTYTPFTIGVLGDALGWSLFGVVWGMAIAGVVYKLVLGDRHPRVSTAAYLVMGWLALLAVGPLVAGLPSAGLIWLAAGGLCYTGGVAFYHSSRRYHHLIWHLFVLAGSTCHFFAVLWYA